MGFESYSRYRISLKICNRGCIVILPSGWHENKGGNLKPTESRLIDDEFYKMVWEEWMSSILDFIIQHDKTSGNWWVSLVGW